MVEITFRDVLIALGVAVTAAVIHDELARKDRRKRLA